MKHFKYEVHNRMPLLLLLQALMLENLQKSSSSHCGLQPNSQVLLYSGCFGHVNSAVHVNDINGVSCSHLCCRSVRR